MGRTDPELPYGGTGGGVRRKEPGILGCAQTPGAPPHRRGRERLTAWRGVGAQQ